MLNKINSVSINDNINTLIRYLVISLPAISRRRVRCGSAKPSYTGQICVTPSPESTTTPVIKPATQNYILRVICA